eukprot:evm.model.scf_75.8 EVM.evm.TU.scf_75.8   scf_75:58466-61004(-)
MHVSMTAASSEPLAFVSDETTSADGDYTMRLVATGLAAATEYSYVVCFKAGTEPGCDGLDTGDGIFRTAAPKDVAAAVKIVWGGDLAGQDVCRDAQKGFPIFRPMADESADVGVLSGDMIYADNLCSATGLYGNAQVLGDFNQSANLEDFRAHWAYNRGDALFVEFLEGTQVLVAWDDHEIVNDAGPSHDTKPNRAAGDVDPEPPYAPDAKLTPLALQTMYEWNPFSATVEEPRHYGSFRYGKHVEIFRLDTRLYRDANLLNDTTYFNKTLLGIEQKLWLKNAIAESDATWIIVQSSVPLSIPTGSIRTGRDGWTNGDASSDGPNTATMGGFEQELLEIIDAFKAAGVKNTVWITADVHFAEVFEYPEWAPNFWEGVVGPLNAGLFPKQEFDMTLGGVQRRFGPFGPESFDASVELGYDEVLKWMNYGVLEISESGSLKISVKDVNGMPVYENTVEPMFQ